MGSHFTNDDLMQENQYAEQYDTRIERQTLDGTAMLRLEMTPKPEAPVAYTRVDFFLTADRWLPVRAVYFEDADVVRTEHFRDVKTIGKRPIPMTIEVVPADKPGESTAGEGTVVTYETLRFDVDVPERIFTPRGLRKAAHQR